MLMSNSTLPVSTPRNASASSGLGAAKLLWAATRSPAATGCLLDAERNTPWGTRRKGSRKVLPHWRTLHKRDLPKYLRRLNNEKTQLGIYFLTQVITRWEITKDAVQIKPYWN